MSYKIRFSPDALGHLKSLARQEQATLLDEIERQLVHEPDIPTRNRKRLTPNLVAPWELRVDDLRVLYDINAVEQQVDVLLIGRKAHEKLSVAGKEVDL